MAVLLFKLMCYFKQGSCVCVTDWTSLCYIHWELLGIQLKFSLCSLLDNKKLGPYIFKKMEERILPPLPRGNPDESFRRPAQYLKGGVLTWICVCLPCDQGCLCTRRANKVAEWTRVCVRLGTALTGGWGNTELDEFLDAGIYGADGGAQGKRRGKSKADVDTLNKSSVHTDGAVRTLWRRVLTAERLSTSYLGRFSEGTKSWSNRDKEPTAASKLFGCFQSGRMKEKCFQA